MIVVKPAWKAVQKRFTVFCIVLFALPVLFYLGMKLLGVPEDMAGTMAFLSGLPSINMVAMLAKNNGSDGDYAVCAVMMTTLACLVTLPIVSLVIALVGG